MEKTRPICFNGDMKRRSNVVPNLVIAFFLGGILIAMFGRCEFFPFSNYNMYSTEFKPTIYHTYKITGITEEGKEWPVPSRIVLSPGHEAILFEAFLRHSGRKVEGIPALPGRNEAYLKRIIDPLLILYNKRRGIFPQYPRLKTLRLYDVSWDWEKYGLEKRRSEDPRYLPPPVRRLITESSP
jgi:hypothetical protein